MRKRPEGGSEKSWGVLGTGKTLIRGTSDPAGDGVNAEIDIDADDRDASGRSLATRVLLRFCCKIIPDHVFYLGLFNIAS